MKALLVAALVGCGSYSTYRTTRIAAPGHTDILFAAQATGASVPGVGGAPLPELAVSARRGVGDRYELQANAAFLPIKQLRTGSVELAAKARLLRDGRWSLAAGGGAGYRLAASSGAIVEGVFVSAPVIGAVELGAHQLVASITGGYQRLYASGARPIDLPFLGSSIGFVWQVKRHVAIFPELGSAYTPTRNFMTEDSRLFHAGVAVLWTR